MIWTPDRRLVVPRGRQRGFVIDPYRGAATYTTVFLLHGEGGTIVDSSPNPRTINVVGSGINTSTAQFKFGASSIYGTGSSSRIYAQMGSDFVGRNWTWEAWVRRDTSFADFALLSLNSRLVQIILGGTNAAVGNEYKLMIDQSGIPIIHSTSIIAANTWTHLAVTCQQGVGAQNTIRMFVNGILEGTSVQTSINFTLVANDYIDVGLAGGGFMELGGFFDEYRFSIGCRYTTNFTPPTAAFP